jgi:sulfur carrier protein
LPTSGTDPVKCRIDYFGLFATAFFEPVLISVTLNGEQRQFTPPITCAGLVVALGLVGKRVALERNGEIVPRSALDAQPLADGDTIEIVVAVGGG